jgi:hypothetical protein
MADDDTGAAPLPRGPFTHTWTPPTSRPVSAVIESTESVGRWPGLVHLGRRAVSWLRDQRVIRWVLWGRQIKTTMTFPSVSMSWELSTEPVEREPFGGSTGSLFKAMFGDRPSDPAGDGPGVA